MPVIIYNSEIGPLTIVVNDGGQLEAIDFGVTRSASERARCATVVAQLEEYFAGERSTFDLPLAPQGTPFQLDVWRELERIPYGSTISYSALAQRIGRPNAVRAVGAANGANPIPIIVPCHRVIGANGTLTGYGGGMAIKRALLDIEQAQRRLPS
jgi:methylated-DNA-[protein]-cysteine S-methyltransferase